MSGINVDPLNPAGAPDPAALVAANLRWVRLVSRKGVEDYVSRCQAAGLMVLAVVTDASEGYVFGGPDLWQMGNEPDAPATSMAPEEYAKQFNFYQATYPQLTWIAAALNSGQPSYWQQVQAAGLTGCAGFAVHPYAKTATEAAALLDAYQQVTPDLPLWVTEWNRPAGEVPGFAAMLRQRTVGDAWFCWADAMVAGFGLDDAKRRLLGALGGTGFPFVAAR